LLQRQRQRHQPVALAVMAPPGAAHFAVVIVRTVGGQFEAQVAPAVEVEITPTVDVVAVPVVLRAYADPAFAFGITERVNHAAPVAGAPHPQAEMAGLAGNGD